MTSSAGTVGKPLLRMANFELLRIISMFLVIAIHLGLHSGIFETADRSTSNYVFAVFLKNIATISVNCYILLSGYFMCQSRFKFEKVAIVYLQLAFYSLFFLALSFVLPTTTGIPRIEVLLHSIFPFTTMQYWFVSSYLVLLFLSPFLNTLIANIKKEQFFALLVILFFLYCVLSSIGWGLFADKAKLSLFIMMYLSGAYVRKYVTLDTPKWKRMLFWYLLFTAGVLVLLAANFVFKKKFGTRPFACESFYFVLNYGSSIAFFLFMGCIKITSPFFCRAIALFSPLTFGVYLFHENPYFLGYLWKNIVGIQHWFQSPLFPVVSIAAMVGIYLAGSLFDWIRQWIFAKLKLREWLAGLRLCKWLDKFFPEPQKTE